jgi:RES domain-containing protein
LKVVGLNDRGLVRLIPATYHKPPILRGLADTDDEAKILAELEAFTSARLKAEREGNGAIDRRELAFARKANDLRLYGLSHINAAFTYSRAGGNRFNPEGRGAWYCAWDALTSAAEVGFHRTRELSFVGVYQDTARYVELLADFIGDFPDLSDDPQHLALNEVTTTGYPAGQALAMALRQEGWRGLVYPSVRQKGGRCFVAFDPGIVQNVRPGASWVLRWDGSRHFSVEGR